MRVKRILSAPVEKSRRIVIMLAVSLVTALFAVVGPLVQPTFADSAVWDGDELTYKGDIYDRENPYPLPAGDSRGRAGEVAYTWIETLSSGDKKAHTIFFDNAHQIQTKDEAILIVYDYQPPDNYSGASAPTTLNITANLLGAEIDNETNIVEGTCSGGVFLGLGWILCPFSMWISEAVDGVYLIVKSYLEVPTATTDDSSGMYALWSAMRTIANVAFVIAFLIIIYSQITSIGISNYNIKAMLPRLMVAAILVNLSYFLCSIAIDVFNVLGYSIQAVLENIRENISITNVGDLTWSNLSNAVLAGGGATVGFIGLSSIGGAPAALGLTFLAGVVSVSFAVFVAFVILAARQALITVLVVISPLAFVAYILPNTESYFHKWLKSLTSLLMFFPIFSLLFGGSQLAGLTIVQRGIDTDQLHVVLLGMVVQIVPLIITPLLMQFSTGLLGKIAGIANNTKKGPIDNLKNDLLSRAEEAKMKSLAKNRRGTRNINAAARLGQRFYRSKQGVEDRKKAYETDATALARDSKIGEEAHRLEQQADQNNRAVTGKHETAWKRQLDIKDEKYQPSVLQKELDIQRSTDESAIATGKFETIQSEMRAGYNPLAERGMLNSEALDELVTDYRNNAEKIALTGTRKAYAERKEKELRAKDIKTNIRTIDGQSLQAYASGIQGEEGELAALATAKAEMSKVMLEDIGHITETMDFDFSKDPAATLQKFKETQSPSMRIALMKAFTKQGSAGDKNIRLAMNHMDQLHEINELSRDDLFDFKDLTSTISEMFSQGEDVKRYLGNMSLEEGAPPAKLKDLAGSASKVWLKASASSFASSPPIAQRQTLKLLAQSDPNKYQEFIQSIPETVRGNIKDEVRELIKLSPEEFLATVGNRDDDVFET